MRSTKIKSWSVCVLAVLMVYSLGCIFNPKPDDNPDPPDPIDWPDLTDKEDVIDYMLLVYEEKAYRRYGDLLHESYIWFMQDQDIAKYGETLGRQEDIRGTVGILKEATFLDLEIDPPGPNSWTEVTEVGEEPCPGCWQTKRQYLIQAQFPGSEKILTGNDYVRFIVTPVEEDGKTIYKIRWAYDETEGQ